MIFPNPLTDGLLRVSGLDAKKLLQGQLTCNVETLTGTENRLGALCNPQGRVISLFRLFHHEDAYFLLMPRTMVPLTLAALKKYAVFYKTELTDASDSIEAISQAVALEKYRDIANGLPAIYPETSGKFLPHDINLHELEAISFDKGCFTGQEIIARMHYKAKLKNHLYATSIHTTLPVLPGLDVYSQHEGAKRATGVIVDITHDGNQVYNVLLVTEENQAKNNHLFLEQDEQTFFIFQP